MTPETHTLNTMQAEIDMLEMKNSMLTDINTAYQEQNNSQQKELKQLSSQYQFLVTSAGAVITTQGQTIDNLKVEIPALRGVTEDNIKTMAEANDKINSLEAEANTAQDEIIDLRTHISNLDTKIHNTNLSIRDHAAIIIGQEKHNEKIRTQAREAGEAYHKWNENKSNENYNEHDVYMNMLYVLEKIAKG